MSEISDQNLKLYSLSPMMILSLFGFGVLLVSLSIAISVGAVPVSLKTVFGVLINKFIPNFVEPTWSMGHEAIIWEIRFPRAILAATVGSGLAVVGASLQAVTRNHLADPHLLGISSGGAFGAILALLHSGLFPWFTDCAIASFRGGLSGNNNCSWCVSRC